MKYKVGDKVRVRKDLIVDKEYGNESFVSGNIFYVALVLGNPHITNLRT